MIQDTLQGGRVRGRYSYLTTGEVQRRWNILVFVYFLGENMLDAFPKTSNNDYNQIKIKGGATNFQGGH